MDNAEPTRARARSLADLCTHARARSAGGGLRAACERMSASAHARVGSALSKIVMWSWEVKRNGFDNIVLSSALLVHEAAPLIPMPPLILAFVLGGLMEENLRRSLLISNGSWDFLWSRPLTASIIAVTISIVSWQVYKTLKNRKV